MSSPTPPGMPEGSWLASSTSTVSEIAMPPPTACPSLTPPVAGPPPPMPTAAMLAVGSEMFGQSFRASQKFLHADYVPRFVFIGPPGVGKSTAVESLLCQASTLDQLELSQGSGNTTPFSFEFVLASGVAPSIVVTAMDLDEAKKVFEAYAANDPSAELLMEEKRALHNLVFIFTNSTTPNVSDEDIVPLARAALDGRQDEFVGWLERRQRSKPKVTLTRPYCATVSDSEWVSSTLLDICRMRCRDEVPWPSHVQVVLPLRPGHAPMVVVDSPGLPDCPHPSNDPCSSEVQAPSAALMCGGIRLSSFQDEDVFILCQQFCPFLPQQLATFVRGALAHNASVANRCGLMLLCQGGADAKVAGAAGKLPREAGRASMELRVVGKLLAADPPTANLCMMPTSSFDAKLPGDASSVLRKLLSWHQNLRNAHLHNLHQSLALCHSDEFKRWHADIFLDVVTRWRGMVAAGTAPAEWSPSTSSLAELISFELNDLLHVYPAQLAAAMRRGGRYFFINCFDLLEGGATLALRRHVDLLDRMLTSPDSPHPEFFFRRAMLQVMRDGVNTTSNTCTSVLGATMAADKDLWQCAAARYGEGSGYMRDVVGMLRVWVRAHPDLCVRDLLARLLFLVPEVGDKRI